MSFPNKFPGECKCGSQVAAGTGTCSKVRGRWVVACAPCSAPQPERELLGAIYWPNGMGYTECTLEYEEAHSNLLDARDAYEADETPANYEAWNRATDALAQLQFAGGHTGKRVTYDKPDTLHALLGGGRISVAPGGDWRIVT